MLFTPVMGTTTMVTDCELNFLVAVVPVIEAAVEAATGELAPVVAEVEALQPDDLSIECSSQVSIFKYNWIAFIRNKLSHNGLILRKGSAKLNSSIQDCLRKGKREVIGEKDEKSSKNRVVII